MCCHSTRAPAPPHQLLAQFHRLPSLSRQPALPQLPALCQVLAPHWPPALYCRTLQRMAAEAPGLLTPYRLPAHHWLILLGLQALLQLAFHFWLLGHHRLPAHHRLGPWGLRGSRPPIGNLPSS